MTLPAPLDPQFALEGPLESRAFPDTLTARVVTPGEHPRLHGYDVESDLARHYEPTEVLFLSLTGELPSPAVKAALRVALTFLAPVSVAHASVHAAALARLCGTTSGSIIGVAAIGLAEQSRALLAEHAELFTWLKSPTAKLPLRYQARSSADRESCRRLTRALGESGFHVRALDEEPTRDAALLCVLFACGLERREQLEAAIVTARLPSAVAEAMSEEVVNFAGYPINLPRYRYEETP
jgi:hypothetical protein